jgi:type I restriction enzyme S subunit
VSDELPDGWVASEIGNLAEIETGSTPSTKHPEFYGGEVPFFKPGDLEQGRELYKVENTLTKEGAAAGRIVPAGSVLVTCIGNLGKSGIVVKPSGFNQQINAVLPSSCLVPRYTYYSTLANLGGRRELLQQAIEALGGN